MADKNEGRAGYRDDPVLDQGAPAPGVWEDCPEEPRGGIIRRQDGKAQRWTGPMNWRRRHGAAIVLWDIDRPMAAENALFDDGARGEVCFVLDFGFRRCGPGSPAWIYGDLQVSESEARFRDGLQPTAYEPEACDGPSLEQDLMADQGFLQRMQDQDFALAVIGAFTSQEFYKGEDPRGWYCSSRRAARMVAGLRGLNESYQDFFMRHNHLERYPDDEPRLEQSLIDQIATCRKVESCDPVEGLAERLPFKRHVGGREQDIRTKEELQAIAPELRKQHEQSVLRAKGRVIVLERELEELRAKSGSPLMLEIKRRLHDLGWRRETDEDRARVKRQALADRVALLDEIEAMEALETRPCPAWAEKLRTQLPVEVAPQPLLDQLSERERAAYFVSPLMKRLELLARTGRIEEDQFKILSSRLLATKV